MKVLKLARFGQNACKRRNWGSEGVLENGFGWYVRYVGVQVRSNNKKNTDAGEILKTKNVG